MQASGSKGNLFVEIKSFIVKAD